MGAQAFLFAMFLINGSWLAALLNLPLVAFNVQKYGDILSLQSDVIDVPALALTSNCLSRVTNNRHMYDATEIFRTLSVHKKECFIKLAFYLLVSFIHWPYVNDFVISMLTNVLFIVLLLLSLPYDRGSYCRFLNEPSFVSNMLLVDFFNPAAGVWMKEKCCSSNLNRYW